MFPSMGNSYEIFTVNFSNPEYGSGADLEGGKWVISLPKNNFLRTKDIEKYELYDKC